MVDRPRRRDRIKTLGKKVLSRARIDPGELFVRRPREMAAAESEPDPRKRVLILTADVGFGHRRAAMALASALDENYDDRCAVTVANPMTDKRLPAFLRNAQVDYDRMVRKMPEVYRLRYQISAAPVSVAVTEPILTVLLFGVLQDLIREVRPNVVISTHPYYVAPMAALSTLGVYNGSVMTVITDFTQVHKLWFSDAADMTFLPTDITYQEALDANLLEARLKVTGIPVNPILVTEHRSKAEIRGEMGWDPGLPLVLVVGSKRVKGMVDALNVLNHMGLEFQMVIVAGGDDKRYERFKAITWHKPAYIYNFVENMAPFLLAADCIVTKAGGLIVSESLACGLPMLLVDVTPGQEEGNADYVVSSGAAQLATTPVEVLEAMFHWLDQDGALLRQYAARAAATGKPRSAYEIAKTIIETAESGPQPVPESRKDRIPSLKEWLSQGGINIDFIQQ